jgi:outer membrane lipoprotein LolB
VTATPTGTQPQRGAWTGRFALAVGPQSLTLDLVSPLGATIARFETDSREARLLVPTDGRLRVERGTDAQALSEQVLGWSLPIERIADWIEGHPSSGRPFHPLSAEDGSDRFEQDGWSVTVRRVLDGKSGRHLQIERPARDGLPSVALRVVLDGPAS